MRTAWLTMSMLIVIGTAVAQVSFEEISAGNAIFDTNRANGVSVADYDNDGDDDIFVCAEPSRLYRNDGGLMFSDVSIESNLSFKASVAVFFDANNDGWLDLLTSSFSSYRFMMNNGDGTFTDVSSTAGIQPVSSQALMVGDVNGDQWLDVYTNNLNLTNQLFINKGDGTFVEVAKDVGLDWKSIAMGGVMVDIDDDSDLDIYVVFDGHRPCQLFINDGSGHFTNQSNLYALNHKSDAMGVDFADFDHDGLLEFYISNLYENALLKREEGQPFVDISAASGTGDNGMGWGMFAFDYDNDTFSDIYVINTYPFNHYPNVLYHNNGNSTFTNVAAASNLEVEKNGVGGAYADLDSDGRLDIVIGNSSDDGVQIFKNNTSAANWFELALVGVSSNKFGIGSRVDILVDGITLFDEVTVGSGYKSQNTYNLHFGLAGATSIDELHVRWPDGSITDAVDILPNNRYLLIQGESLQTFSQAKYIEALLSANALETPPDTFNTSTIEPASGSIARIWNEALLESIRHDFARPTIHARNLFHTSIAMYDAWAAYENSVSTYFLGKSIGNFTCPFEGIDAPVDKHQAQATAISYAAYRLLIHRFQNSPNASTTLADLKKLFSILEYDDTFTSTDYTTGSAAALGNYIAAKIIEFGLQDGSNEVNGYTNQFYQPVNPPFNPADPGDETLIDANHWQPISLTVAIDQNGNPVESTPPFLSPEWGQVAPFALKEADLNKYTRDGYDYWVYHDPGQLPLLDPVMGGGSSDEYMWNFSLVSIWSSHLDPTDGVMIDISPASIGNIPESAYPTTFEGFKNFYNLEQGGDPGQGYSINPKTGLPYQPQIVPRGDYARVLAEFWADGPNSETPPGHWFTILNYVSAHPEFVRKFNGLGELLDPLEWDVKAYFTLGGALHDAAITAWGIKGYYDGIRPVSAIRSMAARGQSTDEALTNYHPAGIPLLNGFVEVVLEGDPLAGDMNENLGKIKLKAWRGPDYIDDPNVDDAGVGWILADNWWPYQRPTFVSPPFAGYISGHSTYSRAGAYVMTWLTGDEYFPGGMSEFHAPMNEYLVFEEGPSVDVVLQWAKYKDASDQCSLSRIWGGIHPPFDDIPGRIIGKAIGEDACDLASKYFNGLILSRQEDITLLLDVYPNPANAVPFVRIKSPMLRESCSLKVVAASGRTEKELQLQANESGDAELSIGGLASGLYVLVFSNGKSTVVRKLVVAN